MALSGAWCWSTHSRVEDCFAAVDYFEKKDLPFVVGVNCFDSADRYPLEDVREALGISPGSPCSRWTPATRSRAGTPCWSCSSCSSPGFPTRSLPEPVGKPAPRRLAPFDPPTGWQGHLSVDKSPLGLPALAQWTRVEYQLTTGEPARAATRAPAARNVPNGIGVRRPALPRAIMVTPTTEPRTLATRKPRKA